MMNPKADGFWSRGEFEKHQGTIIMYPERNDIWRNNASIAKSLIIDMANTIINFEEVFFCVKPYLKDELKGKLDGRIQIICTDYDDIWTRDIAPNFVTDGHELRAVCWGFNAWGGLESGAYYPWDKDAYFAKDISNQLGYKKYIVNNIILEGGAIITDGEGTLITTKSVLLNSNRNPEISMSQMETYLKNYFCAEKVIWLEEGLLLDETNGHIDNICSFVRPGEICLVWTDDENNPQYEVLSKALECFSNSTDAKGRSFIIHKLPLPSPIYISKGEANGIVHNSCSTNRTEGFQLVPSYMNYYIMNGAILLPAFKNDLDSEVRHILKKIYSNREIIQMNSRELLIGGGGFHCVLHEIPQI